MSSLKKQGFKAFIWDFFGKITTHGMSFIVSIFLTRLLEPSDFGLIAMAMVVIGIASIFTDIGLGGALIQRKNVNSIHFSSVFYFNIFIGLILTIITYFFSSEISKFYNNSQITFLIKILSILFILNSFSSIQEVILRKELKFDILTKINLISAFISGIIGIILAFLGAGLWSLVTQILTQRILYTIFIWSANNWRPKLEFSWKALRQLWGYGFRMFLSGLLDKIYSQIDTIIIGKQFQPAILGYFNRAKSLNKMIITYSSSSLVSVLFPILSKVQNDLPRFINIVIKSFGIINFITFMLIGGMYVISHEIILLLYGEKWLQSVYYFKLLILSGFAYPISALLVNVLSSRGNSKAFLRLEIYKKLIGTISLIVLCYYGIKMFLYALIIQEFINGYILNIFYVAKEISISPFKFYKMIFTQIVIAIISVILTLLIFKNIELSVIILLIAKGILFIILYIVLNYLFKAPSYIYFMEQFNPILQKILLRKYK